MTHLDLEKIGWKTIVVDTNSFVPKKDYSETNWLEIFYCREKNYVQIMEAFKGEKGEVRRYTKFKGEYEGINFWD